MLALGELHYGTSSYQSVISNNQNFVASFS